MDINTPGGQCTVQVFFSFRCSKPSFICRWLADNGSLKGCVRCETSFWEQQQHCRGRLHHSEQLILLTEMIQTRNILISFCSLWWAIYGFCLCIYPSVTANGWIFSNVISACSCLWLFFFFFFTSFSGLRSCKIQEKEFIEAEELEE